MSQPTLLIPLTIVVPLGAAAVLAGLGELLGQTGRDVLALVAATATAVLAALTLTEASRRPLVYWFGGWQPFHGTVIGVDYVVDPLGGGLALLSTVLALAALLYSQRFFGPTGSRYPALVLVFLAASVDFAWTGDLFNLFVAFELVAVIGFTLTGYYSSEEAPLQGALNFAVTNTIGGLLVLLAIGMLYGYTGTLNLAQMGEAVSHHRAGAVVTVTLTLLAAGFLTKAAVVPWHFWLPDAYGAAPAPTCVIFAGILSELGLFGLARVWETTFSAAVSGATEARLRLVLGGFGVLTAVVGTAMSLVEAHGRRLLAYVVVAYMGVYLLGFSLLRPAALGGVALLAAGDGLAKAALFLAVGVVRRRRRETGGAALRDEGTRVTVAVVVLVVGALALADLPPFASAAGKDLLVASAGGAHLLVEAVVVITSVGTAAAVLAATARMWRGDLATDNSASEEETARGGTPVAALLLVPAVVLLAGALALGLVPDIAGRSLHAATVFADRHAYAREVLHGGTVASPAPPPPPVSTSAILADLADALAAVVAAGLLVSVGSLRSALARSTTRLRRLHSGHLADQVTWALTGTALLGGLIGLALR